MEGHSDDDKIAVQRLHNIINSCSQQISSLRMQLSETDSALSEISKERDIYKIIGNIMVSSDYSTVKKDLEDRKELILERIGLLEAEKKKAEKELSELSNK